MDIALLLQFGIDPFPHLGSLKEHGAVCVVRAPADPGHPTAGEGLRIHRRDSPAPFQQVADAPQAAEPHQGLELVHLGVGADIHALRLGFDGEVSELEEPLLDRGVPEDEQSALAGVEELGGMEGEHRHVAAEADGAAAMGHPKRMRGVVDDGDAILFGEPPEAVDIADVAVDVDGDNGLGARRHQPLRLGGVKAEGVGVDVREDGGRADALQRVGGRHEGQGGGDDVAAGQPHGIAAQLQGQGAVAEESQVRLRDVQIVGEGPLEPPEHGAVVGQPLAPPDLVDARLELIQVGKERAGHIYWLFEELHCGD